MRASRANDLDLVKLLVDKGADAKAVDANGRTALFYVVSEAKVDLKLVRFLCEAGVAVDAGEWGTGTTPLMCAVKMGHFRVVEFLRGNGSDVNARDLYRKTPLMYAEPFDYDAMRCALGLAES
ncbi:hypothetical protein DIPPA_17284 [Diplonema papillatum]|nr:hypothetical protein DIPPA_17287 [Diplonema papillatum]KAJ9450833.1 hypothetical protein DIPPA_17282 [Diplonema papillatum]KAJ9450834.1 hypothetical protein DIPPA_17284 [Diplonema papillatum]